MAKRTKLDGHKVKLQDFIDECKILGITEINIDVTGVGLAIADAIREAGITVNKYVWYKNKKQFIKVY